MNFGFPSAQMFLSSFGSIPCEIRIAALLLFFVICTANRVYPICRNPTCVSLCVCGCRKLVGFPNLAHIAFVDFRCQTLQSVLQWLCLQYLSKTYCICSRSICIYLYYSDQFFLSDTDTFLKANVMCKDIKHALKLETETSLRCKTCFPQTFGTHSEEPPSPRSFWAPSASARMAIVVPRFGSLIAMLMGAHEFWQSLDSMFSLEMDHLNVNFWMNSHLFVLQTFQN